MEIPEATGFVQIHATTFFIDIDSPVDFHDQLNLTNASLRPEDSLSDTTFASLFHLRHDICFTLSRAHRVQYGASIFGGKLLCFK